MSLFLPVTFIDIVFVFNLFFLYFLFSRAIATFRPRVGAKLVKVDFFPKEGGDRSAKTGFFVGNRDKIKSLYQVSQLDFWAERGTAEGLRGGGKVFLSFHFLFSLFFFFSSTISFFHLCSGNSMIFAN